MTSPDDWPAWLAAHPAPDLQKLVDDWGGWEKIPAEAWARHDAAWRTWHYGRLARLTSRRTWAIIEELKQLPRAPLAFPPQKQ